MYLFLETFASLRYASFNQAVCSVAKIMGQTQNIQCVPLATQPGWLADRCSVSQQLDALQIHTTDTFLFVSHTTNVLLFKFRCNIFIGVRIIKEIPGSVASGTSCIFRHNGWFPQKCS